MTRRCFGIVSLCGLFKVKPGVAYGLSPNIGPSILGYSVGQQLNAGPDFHQSGKFDDASQKAWWSKKQKIYILTLDGAIVNVWGPNLEFGGHVFGPNQSRLEIRKVLVSHYLRDVRVYDGFKDEFTGKAGRVDKVQWIELFVGRYHATSDFPAECREVKGNLYSLSLREEWTDQ